MNGFLRSMALLGSLFLLGGCAPSEIDESDFPLLAARAMCDQQRECTRGQWLNSYFGQEDCVQTWEDFLQDVVDLYDDLDCDYDKREAADAYNDVRDMDCEEFYEDVYTDQTFEILDEIWDSCGNNTVNTFPYSSR